MRRPEAMPLSALLLAAACSDAEPPPVPDTFPRDALVVALPADVGSLVSFKPTSMTDSAVCMALHLPLVEASFDCRISYRPAIARSWEWNDDGTVIAMTLRDDLRWSDGVPFTADDVAYTVEAALDPANASSRAAYLGDLVPGARPLVVDPHHVEWHFTHPAAHELQLAQVSVVEPMPRHATAEPGTDSVVLGRWKVGEWVRGERLELVPNPAWSGPPAEAPKLERVVFRVLPDYATRLVELESGAVDLVENIEVADADRLAREHPEIGLHRRGWRGVEYVAWNLVDPEAHEAARLAYDSELDAIRATPDLDEAAQAQRRVGAHERFAAQVALVPPHPLFGDRAVRVALTQAIDTQRIIDDLLTSRTTGEVYGRPATGTVTPELCQVFNEQIRPLPYDPEAARRALAGAGWADHDGDGTIDKGGRPFRFTLATNASNQRRYRTAVLVQSNLARVGVDAQIARIETSAFNERMRHRDFDAVVTGLGAGLFMDLTPVWHSGPENTFNFVSYANPEVDLAIEQALASTDPDRANALWQRTQELIYADQPVTFLFWLDSIVGLHERFRDYEIGVLSAYGNLHRWWVPADRVRYRRRAGP